MTLPPSPRCEVVELLARAYVRRYDDPAAESLVQTRHSWATLSECSAAAEVALSALDGRLTMLRAQSDQLGASLREVGHAS